MPITHVNSQTGTPQTGGSPGLTSTSVVTKPTGLAVGDLMVTVVHANKAGITAPAGQGWTRLLTQDAGGSLYRAEVWWVVATSTHTAATNFTWTDADASSPMHAATAAYRGVDQNNPINTSSINTGSTGNPQSGPNVTTTYKSYILTIRTVRHSSGTTTFSSSDTERWDAGNNSTVGYFAALYDRNAEVAAGSITGTSVTASSGSNQTDTFAITVALRSADVSASAGAGAATAATLDATVSTGVGAAAGKAAVTASAKQPNVLAGTIAFAGVAVASAAVRDVGRTPRPTTAAATAAGSGPVMFFGTPSSRLKQVPAENRFIAVGTNREAAG